jgi:hypothetical protein
MLKPYPELLSQWQAKVYGPWKSGFLPSPSDIQMYHSPTYLKSVVREHLWLRSGGDRPDPSVASRCEAIVAARPEIAEERRRFLSDPWRRAVGSCVESGLTETVSHFYDASYLQDMVDFAVRQDDPFDSVAIKSRVRDARWAAHTRQEADAPYN